MMNKKGSIKGAILGVLIILFGFVVIGTFLSPNWLYSIGVSIGTVTFIQEQMGFWGIVIGLGIAIAGVWVWVKVD